MWILLLILSAETPGVDRVTMLHVFQTRALCEEAKDRVAAGLAAQYPGDTTYTLTCVLRSPRKQA